MSNMKRLLSGAVVLAVLSLCMPADAWGQQGKGTPSWMNAEGEVIDSTEVEAGFGQEVEGLGDWEGEITGKPAPDSKFTQLQIGMPMKQVTDLVGEPTDQGAYVTAKAFIPFYFGSDKHRYEMAYKGQAGWSSPGRAWAPAAT